MKKILSVASAILIGALCTVGAAANDDPVVYVTIADAEGALAVAQEPAAAGVDGQHRGLHILNMICLSREADPSLRSG